MEKLDATGFTIADDYCGIDMKPGKFVFHAFGNWRFPFLDAGDVIVACKITVARLISNGNGENSATIVMQRLGEEDEDAHADAVCQG